MSAESDVPVAPLVEALVDCEGSCGVPGVAVGGVAEPFAPGKVDGAATAGVVGVWGSLGVVMGGAETFTPGKVDGAAAAGVVGV